MKEKIKKRLINEFIILDGATGTELQKRGMPQGVCPEEWCLQNPKAIAQVHRDYEEAGADVVYTCTFGGNPRKLKEYHIADVEGVNERLARLARRSVHTPTLVAGDIGPTGDFIEPFGHLKFEEAVLSFKRQVKGLLKGGVDLFVIETMIDIQEARAALIAVKEMTNKFVMATMTIEKDGRTLNGTDPVTALVTLQSLGADAVGCNCSAGPKEMDFFIKAMKPYAMVPLVAKPNAGLPQLKNGATFFEMDPKEFSRHAKNIAMHGANLIGGCCGTTPEHIRALKNTLFSCKPKLVQRTSISAVSSARAHVVLESRNKVAIIGESINPTRRKALQQELLDGKTSFVRELAKQQESEGAELLDVNVGAPGVDEKKSLSEVLNVLSVTSALPLVIDSSDIVAVEKALRIYPGRALINSISAERKMNTLLKIAAKYGAMFIALPVTSKGVPATFLERKKIITAFLKAAQRHGFTRADIVIDALVMAVSSMPNAALETLKTVYWCSKTLKCNTVVGLSNVSFGLPQRSVINSTFFYLLKRQGLSLAIANSGHTRDIKNKKAEKVLLNQDKEARNFIAYYTRKDHQSPSSTQALSSKDLIFNAVLDGNREQIKHMIVQAERKGLLPQDMIDQIMIPAINKVGEFFEQKRYFLPQLVASAEAMKIAFDYLEPKLVRHEEVQIKKTVVILATVKGDIHDIGKNIVSLMLKNHGFDVVDLGKDVSAVRILKEISRHKDPIVGLSALMTTTMVNMSEIIALAKQQNLKCRFMLGGAVVTKEYARSLGALYSKDGVEAVSVARKLSGQ